MMNLKNKISEYSGIKLNELVVQNVTPKVQGSNTIILYGKVKIAYVLKILSKENRYIGEETIDEIVYDALVHEHIGKLGYFTPERKIIALDNTNSNPFNSTFIVQKYIYGNTLNNYTPTEIQENLLLTIEKLAKLALAVGAKSERGTVDINPSILIKNNKFSEYIDLYNKNRSNITSKNYFSHYFTSDIRKHAPTKYLDEMLQYVTEATYINKLEKYYLIHADIKPKNIIVSQDNEPILIDWSKACYGDIAQDIAFYIASIFKFYKKAFTESDIKDVLYIYIKNNINIGEHLEQRVYFYLSIILFSISWITDKPNIDKTCKLILDSDHNLKKLLTDSHQILSHSW